jgi:ribosomal protein L40E
MSTASAALAGTTSSSSSSDLAFGNLIDLAMVRTGAASVDICEICNTINLASARSCKGCSHKLRAFYADDADSHAVAPARQVPEPEKRSWNWELAAFWIVVCTLAGMTACTSGA